MAIDGERYSSTATRGEVAGVALKVAAALTAINHALANFKAGDSFDEQMKTIEEKSDELSDIFDDLAGWTPE